ncbi:hypothetical protein DFH09DRAFT_1072417 [Mycena vulgaris]|nr:hypothetical protein DFH09DRAFT_1072417 [Mycena vulgaris]
MGSNSNHVGQIYGRKLPYTDQYLTLDEYANTLSSARAIVDWELSLVSSLVNSLTEVLDISDVFHEYREIDFYLNRQFAMINAQDGKLIFLHIDQSPEAISAVHKVVHAIWNTAHRSIDSESHTMRHVLESLANLQRFSFPDTRLRLDCVYNGQRIVAQLAARTITAESPWSVLCTVVLEKDSKWDGQLPWPPGYCFPTAEEESRDGFTHFIVPLVGKTQKWVSGLDEKLRCGKAPQWEPHHYEVASAVLKEHGFDPTTNAAAQSLNLPLLQIPYPQEPSDEHDLVSGGLPAPPNQEMIWGYSSFLSLVMSYQT